MKNPKFMKYPALALALVLSASALPERAAAHEGHSHGAMAQAPHGGVLKEGKSLNLELVAQGTELQLYPLAKDGKTVAPKDVTLTASAQPVKKPKAALPLAAKADHFAGQLAGGGGHRTELQVEASYKGAKEKFVFQVEPQE